MDYLYRYKYKLFQTKNVNNALRLAAVPQLKQSTVLPVQKHEPIS